MCKQKQIISTGVVRIKEIKRFLYLLPLLLCQAMRTSPRPLPPGLSRGGRLQTSTYPKRIRSSMKRIILLYTK
jgi:hypothetical protein